MLTKEECFKKLQTKYAKAKEGVLEVVMEMGDYIRTKRCVGEIKTDFSDHKSALYLQWNRYNKRDRSALIKYTFEIDELLDVMPKDALIERQTISELSNLLHAMYENPKKDIRHRVEDLFTKTRASLDINLCEYIKPEHALHLHLTLYTCMTLTELSLNGLSAAKRCAIKAFVDLDKFRHDLIHLLQEIERTIKELDEKATKTQAATEQKTIQDCFDARYLSVLPKDSKDKRGFIALDEHISELVHHLNQLINHHIEIKETALKTEKLHALQSALIENDNRIIGRKYFLAFLDEHLEAFNELWASLDDLEKRALEAQILSLKMPGVTSKVLLGMSWASAWLIPIYRYVAPDFIHELTNKIKTPDSVSKKELKRLIQVQLSQFKEQCIASKQARDASLENLSQGAPELKLKLKHESHQGLASLLKANSSAKEMLGEYRRLVQFLEDNVFYYQLIKQYQVYFFQYNLTHDGFWVMLSNLFAKISLIFKTQAARLVDSARAKINELETLELHYKEKLTLGLDALRSNQSINQSLKDDLESRIQKNMEKNTGRQSACYVGKEQVLCLIKNMNALFHKDGLTARSHEPLDAISELPGVCIKIEHVVRA